MLVKLPTGNWVDANEVVSVSVEKYDRPSMGISIIDTEPALYVVVVMANGVCLETRCDNPTEVADATADTINDILVEEKNEDLYQGPGDAL